MIIMFLFSIINKTSQIHVYSCLLLWSLVIHVMSKSIWSSVYHVQFSYFNSECWTLRCLTFFFIKKKCKDIMVNKCILLIEKHPLFPTKSSFIKQMNLCIHLFSTLWVKFFTQFETWQVLSMKYGCEAVEIWNGIMHKREKSGWITFG